MPSETDYALEQAQVQSLATLLGLNVTPARSRYGLELQQRDLLLLLAQKGLGQPTEDTSPPPVEPEPLPEIPPEDANLEAPVVDPVVIADDYVLDPYAYSPANKPRLSAVGTVNYFPVALVNDLSTQPRYLGMRFSPAETRVYRRFEVPLRRQNVAGGEQVALVFLEKVGTLWIVRYKRHMTLLKNQSRIVWARQYTFAAGSTWAIVAGVREGEIKNSIFYGAANPYPAPFASTTLSIGDTPPGVPGTQAEGVTEGSGTHRCIRLYGVNLPKDVIGPLSAEDLPAGAGGGGASFARANVTLTTPSIAAGAQHSADLNLGGSFLAQSVTTSHPARVRLYRTSAARTADASRAASADPTNAIAPYLLLEVIAPLGSDFTIPANVAAAAAATNGVIYALIDNRDTVSRAITATFSNLTLEGVS